MSKHNWADLSLCAFFCSSTTSLMSISWIILSKGGVILLCSTGISLDNGDTDTSCLIHQLYVSPYMVTLGCLYSLDDVEGTPWTINTTTSATNEHIKTTGYNWKLSYTCGNCSKGPFPHLSSPSSVQLQCHLCRMVLASGWTQKIVLSNDQQDIYRC